MPSVINLSEIVKDVLRTITSSLQIPTIIILLLLIASAVVMIGSIIVEIFTDRMRLKAKIPKVIDDIQGMNRDQLLFQKLVLNQVNFIFLMVKLILVFLMNFVLNLEILVLLLNSL